jgi:hypothetical protein
MLGSSPAAGRCDALVERLWNLDKVGDMGAEVLQLCAR